MDVDDVPYQKRQNSGLDVGAALGNLLCFQKISS
jgi:hypothetical protein